MRYNILEQLVFIENFHKETNAVALWLTEIDNRHNDLGNKKSKYLKTRDDGTLFFDYFGYVEDYPEASCTINYPLDRNTPCHFTVTLGRIDEVVDQICEKYREIYREEEESMTECSENPMLANRGISNGKWGIWGHDLGDLVIEYIVLDTVQHKLVLGIGS